MDFAGTAARKLLRGFPAAITRRVAAAAGDYSFSLRPLVKDIFASARGVAAAIIRGVAGKDIFASARGVAAAIIRGVAGTDNFASLLDALASVAHELFLPLKALWWWTQIAVSVLLAVLLAVALVILILLVAAALVTAGAHFLRSVAARGAAMMKAPGAAGFVISRAAFLANPQLYFHLLRTVGDKKAAVAFAAL